MDSLFARLDEDRARAVQNGDPRRWAHFLDRRPLQFALLVLVGTLIAQFLIGAALGRAVNAAVQLPEVYAERLGGQAPSLVTQLTGSVFAAALLVRLGWWRAAGFTPPRDWHRVWLFWPFALLLGLLLLSAAGQGNIDLSDRVWLAITVPSKLLTGFVEEAVVRGLILFALLRAWRDRRRGVLSAVLVSSLIFGLVHLTGLISDPQVGATLTQVVYATFSGIAFAAILLRTNALWLVVLAHGLIDLVSGALAGPPSANGPSAATGFDLVPIILTLPLALYGLFLLRPPRRTAPAGAPA